MGTVHHEHRPFRVHPIARIIDTYSPALVLAAVIGDRDTDRSLPTRKCRTYAIGHR